MNLLPSPEINSLEIGYATETWTEYNDLLSFYHRYIHIGEPVHLKNRPGCPNDEDRNQGLVGKGKLNSGDLVLGL